MVILRKSFRGLGSSRCIWTHDLDDNAICDTHSPGACPKPSSSEGNL